MSRQAVTVRPPVLVEGREALDHLVGLLRSEPAVAIDSESNSFHAYRERVCLLQISTRGGDWVVDPLAVDVRPLGEVLCDGRETVLHGADYDVRCLYREYGWRFPRLFDTMVAARRLGAPALGLSALVEAHFGVRLSKAHQRSDWGRRPLTREQLTYAAFDTHYLLQLRDRLVGEMEARGLEAAARAEFARIAGAEPRERVFDPEGWRRIRGARDLDPAGAAVLRALYLAREERARALDRPPFKVLAEATLVELARRRPGSPAALRAVPGVTESVLRRMGDAIASALRDAAG
ncbi:MAG TPA: ribonuclease D [Anaeromyxobacteraceae bacterium]|nr:ribonuclease D [Anaeromyxobacteraceae bacterium]